MASALPLPVAAMCVGDLQGSDGALGGEIARDAPRAALHLGDLLTRPDSVAASGVTRAHLYAMQSDAYTLTGDTAAAVQAAREGLDALTDADPEPLRRRLRLQYAFMQESIGHLNDAVRDFEVEAARVPADAPELTCVLSNRGYLRFRAGRTAEAAEDLLQAAELARAQGSEMYRIDANLRLVTLYTRYGFYDEARALAEEALAFYEKIGDPVGIMDADYGLGDVLRDQGQLEESRAVYTRALALLRDHPTSADIPALQERLCRVDALMNRADEARQTCTAGYATALANHDPEDARRVLGSLARVELAAGHFHKAENLFDRALADNGVDLPRRWLAQMHLLRAQARAKTGNPTGALADMTIYTDWFGDDRVSKTVAQVGIIRLRFDRALREQELGRLQAEAAAAKMAASERTLTLNVVAVGSGLLLAALSVIVWITRRRRDALRAAQAAQERLAAMGQVTGGIAHDFNNQLTVMQHAVWMLLHRPELAANPEVMQLLRGIERSSADCAYITSQMLSFSRQQNLQPEAVFLGRWLREHLPLIQELAGREVTLQLEVADPEPVAWADSRLLAAALLNLVTNARDALGGAGTIEIRATTAKSPGLVALEVVDSGCGMSPDVMAHAAEPFFTTKPVGRGSGLGLSMVDGFATQSGGSLHIRSTPGQGTTVRLELPAASR